MRAFITYGLPGLAIGTLAGWLSAQVLQNGARESGSASSSQGEQAGQCAELDYGRIARACAREGRGLRAPEPFHARSTRHPGQGDQLELTNDAQQALRTLDAVMEQSLERNEWSRRAGMHARGLLERVPEERAAEFERVFQSAISEGSLRVEAGAWVPVN